MIEYQFDQKRFTDLLNRCDKGDNRATVAEKIGSKPSNVSEIYNQKRKPTIEQLARLSIAYDISADELLGLDERKKKKVTEPSARMIMTVIDYLFSSGFIRLEKSTVTDTVVENTVTGYPDYVDEDVVSIIPNRNYLRNLLEVYNYLCGMPNEYLKLTTIQEWLKMLPDIPLKDIPPELYGLPFC